MTSHKPTNTPPGIIGEQRSWPESSSHKCRPTSSDFNSDCSESRDEVLSIRFTNGGLTHLIYTLDWLLPTLALSLCLSPPLSLDFLRGGQSFLQRFS